MQYQYKNMMSLPYLNYQLKLGWKPAAGICDRPYGGWRHSWNGWILW